MWGLIALLTEDCSTELSVGCCLGPVKNEKDICRTEPIWVFAKMLLFEDRYVFKVFHKGLFNNLLFGFM